MGTKKFNYEFIYKAIILFFISISLHGCSGSKKIHPTFKPNVVKGGEFYLQTFSKDNLIALNQPNQNDYIFYIEGDGLITRDGINPTPDPTPHNKLVLRLAYLDNRPNVFYIARPCQYLKHMNPKCNYTYWTHKRWAPEVVTSINEVINKISNNHSVHLIGFSGGGGIAVLIAAINPNVKSITTIAGNLDIVKFNKIHKSQQCKGSLNPIAFAHKLHIPQTHLVGMKDTIVPEIITDNYIKSSNNKYNKKVICETCSHNNDEWMIFWQDFLHKQALDNKFSTLDNKSS